MKRVHDGSGGGRWRGGGGAVRWEGGTFSICNYRFAAVRGETVVVSRTKAPAPCKLPKRL